MTGMNCCLELFKIYKSEIFIWNVHRLWKKAEVEFNQTSMLIINPDVPQYF